MKESGNDNWLFNDIQRTPVLNQNMMLKKGLPTIDKKMNSVGQELLQKQRKIVSVEQKAIQNFNKRNSYRLENVLVGMPSNLLN